MKLDPKNEYDEFAVKIMQERIHLGFVPSIYSREVSERIKLNSGYVVIVSSVDKSRNIPDIYVNLYPIKSLTEEEIEKRALEYELEGAKKLNRKAIRKLSQDEIACLNLTNVQDDDCTIIINAYLLKDGGYYIKETKIFIDNSCSYSEYIYDDRDGKYNEAIDYENNEEYAKAISIYEALIQSNYSYLPFYRLCIIYRKFKDIDNELRIIDKWAKYEKYAFNKDYLATKGLSEVYKRLDKVRSLKEKQK